MTITFEMLLTIAVSVLSGAGAAFLGNRIVNAEVFSHPKRHCAELDDIRKDADRAHVAAEEAKAICWKHGERLGIVEFQLKIDRDRKWRMTHDHEE